MLHMLLSDAIIRNLHILQDSRGIGAVLTGLLIYYLDENFTEASRWCYLLSDTISRFIRDLHVLQVSRKRLRGKVESWLGSWWKYHRSFKRMLSSIWPSLWTFTSFKTPGGDLEDSWGLDRVTDVLSWWKLHRSFLRILPSAWYLLKVQQEPTHSPRLQEDTQRIGGVLIGLLMKKLQRMLFLSDTINKDLSGTPMPRKRHSEVRELWQASWSWILI